MIKRWLFKKLFKELTFDVESESPFGNWKTRAFLKDGVLTIERHNKLESGWILMGQDIFHLEGDI